MENSVSEIEPHQSFRSPPKRRRSTFFERRNSVVQTLAESVDLDETNTEDNEEHNQYLTRYYEQLLAEKEQWKKEVKDRRNKYHDLRQHYQIATSASSRSSISYAALTNEDIEFIKEKPNLSKLVDSQMQLHNSVKVTMALFKRMNELDDVILSYSEDKVNKVTDYILEHSTVEPMEN